MRVEHEHVQPGVQLRELHAEVPFVFRDGDDAVWSG